MLRLGLLALVVAFVSPPGLVPGHSIVGHAACGDSAFVLTEAPELIEIQPSRRHATAHPVKGLAADDRVWGLGCLTDGSLWTLAAPHAVVRIDRTGQLGERVDAPLPRIGLFGAGDRLLVQQLPIAPGTSALVTTLPRQPESVRAWPALVARVGASPEEQVARNIVNCGLRLGSVVPCWFPSDNSFVISDGGTASRVSLPQLNTAALDRTAPIWDIALVGGGRYWLLATMLSDGRRVGGRLYRARQGSPDVVSLDLTPPARLIVFATEARCVLLTVTGSLMEVVSTPERPTVK